MPEDSILDMVNNVEPMYNDKQNLYNKWGRNSEDWDAGAAFKEARALAAHFAESIESLPYVRGKYSEADINEAAREMIEEFRTEELPKWSTEVKEPEIVRQEPMSQYELEQARKNEDLAYRFGFARLRELLPAPADKIRAALAKGDRGLRSIPLRKWDAAAAKLHIPGLTLSDKVGLLKHIAVWHLD